jgi:hypothetical protein
MITQQWYKPVEKFDFGKEDIQDAFTFTQLVWKGSKELGIGMVKDGQTYYTIGLYYPAGNIEGIVKKNVHKPIGDDDEDDETSEEKSSSTTTSKPKTTSTQSNHKEDDADKDDLYTDN